jgi:hypothetical protein
MTIKVHYKLSAHIFFLITVFTRAHYHTLRERQVWTILSHPMFLKSTALLFFHLQLNLSASFLKGPQKINDGCGKTILAGKLFIWVMVRHQRN